MADEPGGLERLVSGCFKVAEFLTGWATKYALECCKKAYHSVKDYLVEHVARSFDQDFVKPSVEFAMKHPILTGFGLGAGLFVGLYMLPTFAYYNLMIPLSYPVVY
tara:strand:+ start:1116 stop:1433 length:318 start_codon:yes stop_codon:yes gene_type:complete